MNLKTQFLVNNECYIIHKEHNPKGIMVHSTGANNPYLNRYVSPDDGLLGPNLYGNHWNQFRPSNTQVCVHAFIGKLKDGTVATYQTLPWNIAGWHSGEGSKGNANFMGYIGFEICEDGLNDSNYFSKVYKEAVELCVYLCKTFKLTDKDIICHCEGASMGIACNHADVMHWFPKFGKSMDTFRLDVKSQLNSKEKIADGSKGELLGVNVQRTADALVMYVNKKSTGTNKYGTEAIIDPYGIVTKIEVGKGNASLGKGKVLSGHGKADKWIRENVKEGYLLWSENGTIKISKKQHRSVDGKNGSRPAESLVVYDTPGTVAKTNPYGREVQIVNGVAVCDPVYGKGHMPVPKDGYVLSGHGAASDWIYKNIKKGTKVAFNDKYITIG